MAKIDETKLVNRSLPEKWKCPHCGRKNRMDKQAERIFLEFFKVIRQCPHCGYLHIWTLELTEDFKKSVVNMLMEGRV